jgi:GT2 family glycosyltransferase
VRVPPAIDVVVPTRNRVASLLRCLEGLAAQTLVEFRVIVVDDASDGLMAEAIPAPMLERLDMLILRNQAVAGPARARNRGVAAGTAPYITFLDDDVRPHPDLLRCHHAVVAESDRPTVAIGPLLNPTDCRPTPWNRWDSEHLAAHYEQMARDHQAPTWRQFYAGNAFLRRADLLAVGGFDERFARSEDIELGLRLWQHGCDFVFVPGAVGWHYAQRSLEGWLEIARSYARFDVLIENLHPDVGWLRTLGEELRSRHWLLRAVRRVAGGTPWRAGAVRLATGAARVLDRARMRASAMHALSVAYDLEYTAALAAATRGPPHRTDDRR